MLRGGDMKRMVLWLICPAKILDVYTMCMHCYCHCHQCMIKAYEVNMIENLRMTVECFRYWNAGKCVWFIVRHMTCAGGALQYWMKEGLSLSMWYVLLPGVCWEIYIA